MIVIYFFDSCRPLVFTKVITYSLQRHDFRDEFWTSMKIIGGLVGWNFSSPLSVPKNDNIKVLYYVPLYKRSVNPILLYGS